MLAPLTYGPHEQDCLYSLETWDGARWQLSGYGWAGVDASGLPSVHYPCFGLHPEVTLPPADQLPPKTQWARIGTRVGWASFQARVERWLADNPGAPFRYLYGCVQTVRLAATDGWDSVIQQVAKCPTLPMPERVRWPEGDVIPMAPAPQIYTGYVEALSFNRRVATVVAYTAPGLPRYEIWTTLDDASFPRGGTYGFEYLRGWPVGRAFTLGYAENALRAGANGLDPNKAARHVMQLTALPLNATPF